MRFYVDRACLCGPRCTFDTDAGVLEEGGSGREIVGYSQDPGGITRLLEPRSNQRSGGKGNQD